MRRGACHGSATIRRCQARVVNIEWSTPVTSSVLSAYNAVRMIGLGRFWQLFSDATIKQIRGFVGSILQPEMKPPKSVPARTINTSKR